MVKKKRIGIIGTGNISHFHIMGYKNLDNVEVVAACDIDEEKLQNFAKQYGIENTFTDYNEMLKMEDLDAVSVCTWNCVHADASIAALKAGKHVLCEKPLATTVEEAVQMEKTAKETGCLLMVAYVMRYEKRAQTLLDLINAGRFGHIYFSKVSYLRRAGGPVGWYTNKKLSGGGPLIDLGVHVVDICHYLIGKPKPVTISGVTFKNIGLRRNVKGIERYIASGDDRANNTEDMCVALVRFDNGSVMEIETSYSQHIKEDMIKIECFGTKGSFVYDYEPELKVYSEMDDYLVDMNVKFGWESDEDAFNREVAHFIECIDDRSKCISPAEDGVATMKILCGIYESAELGKEIVVG